MNTAKPVPQIGRRVYYKRGEKYYIGTVIGTRRLIRTQTNFFGGDRHEWTDISLLVEDSHRHRLQVWESETFEAGGTR